MIRFGSIKCQDAENATETAARGDGELWEMCAYWMMDAHKRECVLFIWSVRPFSREPIKVTVFTNTDSLQRVTVCSDDLMSLMRHMAHRVKLLYIILVQHTLYVKQGDFLLNEISGHTKCAAHYIMHQ